MNAHKLVALLGWLIASVVFGTPAIERSFAQATQFAPTESAPSYIAHRGSGRILTEVDEIAFPV